MEILITADEFSQMQEQLVSLPSLLRLQQLTALAWYSVEKDSSNALELAHLANDLLPQIPQLDAEQRWEITQRLQLTFAKVAWLDADFRQSQKLASNVLANALAGGREEEICVNTDHLSQAHLQIACDAHHLLALVCNEQSKTRERDQHWQQCIALAKAAGEHLRSVLPHIYIALRSAEPQASAITPIFGPYDAQAIANGHPALACWLFDFWGAVAFNEVDYAASINRRHFAYEYALATCQFPRAITCCLNIGMCYANLNDHDAALKWKQRGLRLAQECAWPSSMGLCLVSCGETLRQLRQFSAARVVLQQAFNALAGLAHSRYYALALRHGGFLALDENDSDLAFSSFSSLLKHPALGESPGLRIYALRGLAETFSAKQEPEKALHAAHQALELAQQTNNTFEQAESYLCLARLYRQHQLPPLGDIPQASLHYLQKALQLAEDIPGHRVSAELLDALADALAEIMDFEQAYAMARRAADVREKTNSIAATNRAIAMQVQYQTERSQAQNQHHKKLAQAEARRVAVLQQTSNTLAHLGAIGQEVTAHLEAGKIFQALYSNLQALLEMSAFGVYFLDRHTNTLTLTHAMEDGMPLPQTSVQLDHATSYAARCIREEREIVLELQVPNTPALISPGTLASLSCLFAPMVVTGRIIGAMSIQAMRPLAFSEREQLIFRTLCAYGAIAFDNAKAYQQLQETKAKLVAKEKFAALGGLVAGVAHELNTPIGNSMLMASALQLRVEAIQLSLQDQSLRLAQLNEFLGDTQLGAGLIANSLRTAADLVASFKQVAVDRTSEICREFDLRQTCQELVATMMNQIRQAGHQFSVDMPEGIILQSYPGPLGQVIGNLISNAMRHAFPNNQVGKMRLFCPPSKPGWVQIRFCDNGCGIPEADLKRIFDPFFTTRMGQGNAGLGLSISHNIVTGILGGRIRVDSKLAQGTCFIVELPMRVGSLEKPSRAEQILRREIQLG